jgi:hypothetical protein
VAETLLNLLKEEPSGIQCHYEEIKKLVGAIHNFDPDTWYSYYIAGQYHKIYDTMVLISWSLESKYEKAHMKQKTIKLLKYYQKILNIPDFFDACVRFRENVLYFHNDEE